MINNQRGNFERSEDTNLLVTMLSKIADQGAGTTVSYEELSRAIGRPVASVPWKLWRARKILQDDHGVIFQVIRGEGLKVASDSEITSDGEAGVKRLGRSARRNIRKLRCVDFSKLSSDEKIKYAASASVNGVVEFASRSKQFRQLAGKVADTEKTIPVPETLRALISTRPDPT